MSTSTSTVPIPADGTIPSDFLSAESVFDDVGPAYEDAFAGLAPQAASIQWLLSELEAANIKPAKTVDIGCGTGRPVCAALADAGHDVLGIDISGAMIAAARERVPSARFEKLDVRNFNPPENTFDVATIYFGLIAGISQAEIRAALAKVSGMVRPGGLFVFATVPLDAENVNIEWMGKPVTVSSLGKEDVLDTIRGAGFEVVYEGVTAFTPKGVEAGICEDEGKLWEEEHLFVYARKPAAMN